MPDPLNFTEPDADTLRKNALAIAEEQSGELLYPGDERRILLDTLIYILLWFISLVNKQCRARLLDYAHGKQLDALGARYNCSRLQPAPARVTLMFTLDTVRPHDVTIPAGTTVTSDNKVLFATDSPAVILSGQSELDGVRATATTGGIITNGIPIGAIQSFVDRVPFVSSVINTSESTGGDNGEPYPLALDPVNGDDGSGDNSYRERIRLAPASFSAAGSVASYEFWTRSASALIDSVSVTSDQEAGQVEIYVTEKGGKQPSEGTLAAIRETVTSDSVRPLNDKVVVSAPTEVSYDIELKYYVAQADESAAQHAIEDATGAVAQYIAWQSGAIGRDINPDRLRAFLLDHCIRMDVTSPTFTTISHSQIARHSGTTTITHEVSEE